MSAVVAKPAGFGTQCASRWVNVLRRSVAWDLSSGIGKALIQQRFRVHMRLSCAKLRRAIKGIPATYEWPSSFEKE